MGNLVQLSYNGFPISLDLTQQQINLNQLYESVGKPPNQDPRQWKRLSHTQALIQQISQELNVGFSHILKSKRGKGGGTFAHWKLALDYAGYLSPELRSTFYDVIRQFVDEEVHPEKGVNRSIKNWQRQGKSQRWISDRLDGIKARHQFTDALQEHGISQGWQYALCTNAINQKVLGGTAKEVKHKLGLSQSASLRDHLSELDNAALRLAELIAEKDLQDNQRQGFKQCQRSCSLAGDKVFKAIVS